MADELAMVKLVAARDEFDRLILNVRPNLHRYCARMVGSVFDAEDIVQEAIAKAYYQLPMTEVRNVEGWLFRIVHNKTIDFLREAKSSHLVYVDEFPPEEEASSQPEDIDVTTYAMSVFLQLTPLQRSCVILMDVIGYTLAEISEMLDLSVGAIKAALHRGRENLRKLSRDIDEDNSAHLDVPNMKLLAEYVDRFNARDFAAVRSMLAEDVRLDLLERIQRRGADNVGRYFTGYETREDWRLTLGYVDRQPAILVSDVTEPDEFKYVMHLEWNNGKIVAIRDYRFAPWVLLDASIVIASRGE